VKKRHFNHRSTMVVLCLLVALALLAAGLSSQDQPGSASAATTSPISPSSTASHVFMFSNPSPANGATGVAIDVNITVDFNHAVNPATMKSTSFFIKKSGGSTLAAGISASATNKRFTLNPSTDLTPGTSYTVTLTSDIKDTDGLALNNAGSWNFVTDTAPEIESRSPLPNETGVALDTNISVTFTKGMNTATITSGSFYIKKQGGNKLGGAFSFLDGHKSVVFNPETDLEPGTVYEVTLTPSIESESHIPVTAVPIVWTFTTTKGAPTVTAKVPAAGATGVPVNQIITATFDKDMDEATITSATFYVAKQGGTPLPATVTYSQATRTASLDPTANLETGTTYLVTLTDAITGNGGKVLKDAPVTWTFTTIASAPMVTAKIPAAGAAGVAAAQSILATFNVDMDATTLTSATFYVAKQGGSPLPATVTYNTGTRTATLDPLADLDTGAIYQVTLSNAVKGADGQTLAGAPVTWNFSTGASTSFPDVTPGVTHYATAIIALAGRGIITGYDNGTFKPNNPVVRQQFAKMIVLTMGYTVTGSEVCPYTDVPLQQGTDPFYPSKYVAVCAAHGITTGKTPTTFVPGDPITHQQLISMVVRAADLAAPPAAYAPPFTSGRFSTRDHYLNARKAAYAGLLDGLLGMGATYNFGAGSTRGECAQVLYNLTLYLASQ
jgi:hypothetical protein